MHHWARGVVNKVGRSEGADVSRDKETRGEEGKEEPHG